ncbi:hypothetical protein AB0M34_32510 [Nocardia sp. NPDC050193]
MSFLGGQPRIAALPLPENLNPRPAWGRVAGLADCELFRREAGAVGVASGEAQFAGVPADLGDPEFFDQQLFRQARPARIVVDLGLPIT